MISSASFSIFVVLGLVLLYFSVFVVHKLLVSKITKLSQTLLFPSLFVIADFASSKLNPYGSWTVLAYSQYQNKELLQFLSVFGIFGISFLVVWFASVFVLLLNFQFNFKILPKTWLIYPILFCAVLFFGGLRLNSKGDTNYVQIASISVPDNQKSSILLEKLFVQSEKLAKNSANKIIFWAESNGITNESELPQYISKSKQIAKDNQVYFFPTFLIIRQNQPRINKIMGFDPKGDQILDYLKYKPIPGESVVKGENLPQVIVAKIDNKTFRLATAICFDNDFPEVINQMETDILLQPSRDWAAIDPKYTYNLSFRAIENGFSTVKQTGFGLSQAVDYHGNVLSRTDFDSDLGGTNTMISKVPIKKVWTVYCLVKDSFVIFCLGVIIFFIWENSSPNFLKTNKRIKQDFN